MAVQQIGLGPEPSKKSLFTKAAPFNHANTVYFFYFIYFFYFLSLTSGKIPTQEWHKNTLTSELFQTGVFNAGPESGQVLMQHLCQRRR